MLFHHITPREQRRGMDSADTRGQLWSSAAVEMQDVSEGRISIMTVLPFPILSLSSHCLRTTWIKDLISAVFFFLPFPLLCRYANTYCGVSAQFYNWDHWLENGLFNGCLTAESILCFWNTTINRSKLPELVQAALPVCGGWPAPSGCRNRTAGRAVRVTAAPRWWPRPGRAPSGSKRTYQRSRPWSLPPGSPSPSSPPPAGRAGSAARSLPGEDGEDVNVTDLSNL